VDCQMSSLWRFSKALLLLRVRRVSSLACISSIVGPTTRFSPLRSSSLEPLFAAVCIGQAGARPFSRSRGPRCASEIMGRLKLGDGSWTGLPRVVVTTSLACGGGESGRTLLLAVKS